MTASPNLSSRMRDEIDRVYTFPIKYGKLGFDCENSTVLVNHHDDGTATVILNDPPGRHGYYDNYPEVTEDEPKYQAKSELATDLVESAETILDEYDPQTSSWTANSGNRSLRDIYVEVDSDEVDEILIKMWQILVEFKPKYLDYLRQYEPDELVSPDASLKEKVDEIAGGLDQPYKHDSE